MTQFPRIMRSAANLASAEAASKVVALVTMIVLARALRADGFGVFAAASAFGAVVAVFADGGLAYFTVREIARVPRSARRFLWTAYALRLFLCLAAVIAGAALLPLLRFHGVIAIAALVFAGSSCLDGIAAQALALFRGRQEMHVEARIVAAGRVVFLVGIIGIVQRNPSVLSVATVAFATSFLTAIVATFAAARIVPPILPNRRAALAIGRAALPFAASGLLTYVFFRIDVLLLRAFGIPDASIGAYSAAYRIMEAPRLAPRAIAAGLLPAAATLAAARQRDTLVRLGLRAAALSAALVAPAAVAFAIAPHLVIRLVFGAGFAGAATLLLILSPMPLVIAVDAIAIALTNATGGQSRLVRIFVACSLLNVTANVVLIPHFAALGAAIVTLATEVFLLLALLPGLRGNAVTSRSRFAATAEAS